MKNKEVVIQLIHQDLRHNQLIWGLRRLGLESDKHFLSIIDIVLTLTGIENEKGEKMRSLYYEFLYKVEENQFPVAELGEGLRPLAEECYEIIVSIIHKESNDDKEIL